MASESGGRKGLSDAEWAFQLLARPPSLREVLAAMARPPLTGVGMLLAFGVLTGALGLGTSVLLTLGRIGGGDQ